MAITPPTASLFKARYPLFAGLDDALIDLVIADVVGGYVDETWREADRVPAILALTAHMLAMEGHPLTVVDDDGSSGGGEGNTVTDRKVASIKVGDVAVSYSGSTASTSGGGSGSGTGASITANLNATAYGQQYVRLRNKNFPAVVVV